MQINQKQAKNTQTDQGKQGKYQGPPRKTRDQGREIYHENTALPEPLETDPGQCHNQDGPE